MDSTNGTPVDALTSLLKNPGGGAAEVNLDENNKMVAGGIMHGVGFGALLVGTIIMGSLTGKGILNLLVMYVLVGACLTGVSFIGVNMGAASSKSTGDAVFGGGVQGMFFGVCILLVMLFAKILLSPSELMIILMMTVCFGLLLVMGVGAYGLWANRYQVPGMMASILSVVLLSAGIFIGSWISGKIMSGGMGPMSMMERMF
jgi:hypothetical protein